MVMAPRSAPSEAEIGDLRMVRTDRGWEALKFEAPLLHLAEDVRGSLFACDHDDRLRSITLVSPKPVKRTTTGQHVSTRWHPDGTASVRTDGDGEVGAVDTD